MAVSLRARLLAVVVVAAVPTALVACGNDDADTTTAAETTTSAPTAAPDDTDETTTTTTEPERVELVEPVVEGTPEVFTADYGLPDTTGWQTYVAFEVTNPSDHDLTGVRYRVQVASDDGETQGRSEGNETMSLRASETRWVVARLNPNGPNAPTTAEVTVYATAPDDTDRYADPVHVDTSLWESSNRFMDCSGFTVGCDVTADIVFSGDEPQRIVEIVILARDGADGSGPMTFAGVGDVEGSLVHPGQTIPITGHAVGHHANTPTGDGLGEVHVFSVPA